MLTKTVIEGYIIDPTELYVGANSIIYAGTRQSDQAEVIVKVTRNEHPTPDEILRFQHEYEITKDFKQERDIVHAYHLEKIDNSYALVMEKITAPTLKSILEREQKFEVEHFLEIALGIAEALGHVHQHHIIHKDINPSNIMCDFVNSKITIIDFGLSANLPKERVEIVNANALEGTLAYLSPEQTGRMNRGIDYRTDFYSLGVTFYQMLTNKLPFPAKDPMELVHAHIAIVPPSPHEINQSIPVMLSDIVMKLMSKKAEDRYQNSNGLIADLKICREQLQKKGMIPLFTLGQHDIYSRFQIPEKLYGREEEVTTLLSSYEDVSNGKSELMLVSGYSGIGKSSLVNEIHKSISSKHGYFISGKYDQYQHNIPYTALISAFSDLMKQILTESTEKIASIKGDILAALENNGRIITDVIPDLIAIIGEQPPVPVLGSEQSLNRFNYFFQKFISVLCSKDHPLVVFLDDLQWADTPSLKLIETLLSNNEVNHLLMICAYRSNEVDETHLFMIMLEKLKAQQAIIKSITLGPISQQDIASLLSDTLYQTKEDVKDLAEILKEKTDGNPFFLIQLLNSFYKEGLIYFDSELNQFTWKIKEIKQKQIAGNVVELMVAKLKEMSLEAQKALQYAACIGNQFDLTLQADISHQSAEEMLKSLHEPLREGYIITQGESYRAQTYYFAHDRIQQAAHMLMNDNERQQVHLAIAEILSINETGTIFDIAGHFNAAFDLVENKRQIAEINLKASIAAVEAAAFESAYNYAISALKGVDDSLWTSDYKLMFSIYDQLTKCAHLCARYEEMDNYANTALKNTNNISDEMKITITKIQAYQPQRMQVAGLDLAINTLAKAGVKLPRKPTIFDVWYYIAKVRFQLRNKTMKDLLMLPEMSDEKNKLILMIMKSIGAPSYQTEPRLFVVNSCMMVMMVLQHGNTKASATAFGIFGTSLCGWFEDIQKGCQFGELASLMIDKYHDEGSRTLVNHMHHRMMYHWIRSVHSYLDESAENFNVGLNRGDLEYGCYGLNTYLYHGFVSGIPLQPIIDAAEKYRNIALKYAQKTAHSNMLITAQAALNLYNLNSNKAMLIGEICNEEVMLQEIIKVNDLAALSALYLFKIMLEYYFDDEKSVTNDIKIAENIFEFKKASISTFIVATYYFYKGMTLLRLYSKASLIDKFQYLRKIKKIIKQLKKWNNFSPANQLHRYLLLQAEYQFHIRGNLDKAAIFYDEAIQAAARNEFLNEEGLANELAAKLYLSQGLDKIARMYMLDAKYAYTLWGANAKVAQLEASYPLLLGKAGTSSSGLGQTIQGTETIFFSNLDISTIQKSSTAISSTIVLSDLLKRMMHIVIENAGAEKSYLLLNKNGNYTVEAEGGVEPSSYLLESRALTPELLPISVINYVIHSMQPVVINDAMRSDQFKNDEYIQRYKPLSILAFPLINQGEITGVLYLENNLVEAAFTEENIYVLNLLSSQMAISIDNARLYENTKALNTSFERFLPANFLNLLQKDSVLDIGLGDHIEETMSIIFADIRGFTTRSEKMTPQQNFDFINSVLEISSPIIREHNGFVDKYIGDAIMALFPQRADDAVRCALEMQQALQEYNQRHPDQEPVQLGIGINTGLVMLGTVGENNRMNATVISDSVNIASRTQSLTKTYQIPILLTEATFQSLERPGDFQIEEVASVLMKGKAENVKLFQVKKCEIQ